MAVKEYPNFDHITFFYDFLKKLVFGNQIDKAQSVFLSYLPSDISVLIIGGGTGEILMEIYNTRKAKEITYLEYSEKMLGAAKRRIASNKVVKEGESKITFINGSVEVLNPYLKFDVVFTPFILDVIEQKELLRFMKAIDKLIQPNGLWLFSDFLKPSSSNLVTFYHKILTKIMFFFFYLTTSLKGKDIPDFDAYFLKCGYTMLASKYFNNGFIQSKVWQKKYNS